MPATDFGVFHFEPVFLAGRLDLNLLNQAKECSADARVQDEVRTRVRDQKIRNWAGLAQCRFPGFGCGVHLQQAAFFKVLAAIIIPVKILALFTVRCFHNFYHRGR